MYHFQKFRTFEIFGIIFLSEKYFAFMVGCNSSRRNGNRRNGTVDEIDEMGQ